MGESILGWAACVMLTLCAFPQVLMCYKQGHARGLSKPFLFSWLVGEALMIAYLAKDIGWNWPIATNNIMGIIFLLFIFRYVFFPRVQKKRKKRRKHVKKVSTT